MAEQTPDIPREIQDQLNKTPTERKADLLAKRQSRLAAMTPQERQKLQDRADRTSAVPANKRPAFMQASRLASAALVIKARVDGGMPLRDVIDSLDAAEKTAVNWLVDQLTAARAS
jgi:hypothetical protein